MLLALLLLGLRLVVLRDLDQFGWVAAVDDRVQLRLQPLWVLQVLLFYRYAFSRDERLLLSQDALDIRLHDLLGLIVMRDQFQEDLQGAFDGDDELGE